MTPQPPRKKTAVVCDDHASLVHIIKHLLSMKGYAVATAGDGSEGLELLRDDMPDLLLLDLNMPETDGLAVLEALRSLAKRPYTIVISGQESDEKRERAVALGAQEIWKKPFNPSALLGRLDSLTAQGLL